MSVQGELATAVLGITVGLGACSAEQHERLGPLVVGMHGGLAPIYDDGELAIYEVKQSLQLPIVAPSQQTLGELARQSAPPFERYPWVTAEDLQVEVSFTLSNLDAEDRRVEVLIDPWNEFGRYWPGLSVVDAENGEVLPNLSGIDELFLLPGTSRGSASRVFGTYTFEDMEELAIDFATAINIIETFAGAPAVEEDADPRVTYVNHAFSRGNRSYDSRLVAPYQPDVIPALVGFDFGLRANEPMNVALEISVEIVDSNGDRLLEQRDQRRLPEPTRFFTIGSQ